MVGGNSLVPLASGGGGKPTYKVGCSLCTCKCVVERRKGKTHTRTCLAGPGGAGHGVARLWVLTHDVCMNSPPKYDPKPHRSATSFCRLDFAMSPCLIRIDRDRHSQLRDAVTLGGSSL
jgi:hypothetical protein